MNNIVWRREFDGHGIAFVITWTIERQINEVPIPVVLVAQVAPKCLRVLVCNGDIGTEVHTLDGVRPCSDIRQGLALFQDLLDLIERCLCVVVLKEQLRNPSDSPVPFVAPAVHVLRQE